VSRRDEDRPGGACEDRVWRVKGHGQWRDLVSR